MWVLGIELGASWRAAIVCVTTEHLSSPCQEFLKINKGMAGNYTDTFLNISFHTLM